MMTTTSTRRFTRFASVLFAFCIYSSDVKQQTIKYAFEIVCYTQNDGSNCLHLNPATMEVYSRCMQRRLSRFSMSVCVNCTTVKQLRINHRKTVIMFQFDYYKTKENRMELFLLFYCSHCLNGNKIKVVVLSRNQY